MHPRSQERAGFVHAALLQRTDYGHAQNRSGKPFGQAQQALREKPGEFAESYGVGERVYIDQPFQSKDRIAMVSVTTQRKDLGLQADPSYVFDAAEALCRLMANNRLTRLYAPTLGSGHGGLKPEISLICMLIAFGELAQKPTGRHLRDLNIVIYRARADSAPTVDETSVRRALDFVSRNLAR